jgi:trk system potassium uptake protein TrkA
MGAQRVIARANDDLHARILKLVGAHQIVNPEREFGERFASTIMHDRIIGELPLGSDLLITELRPPAAFVGQGLGSLDLARRFGVTVVAIRRSGEGAVLSPDVSDPIRESDVLIVVSRSGAVSQLMERV